MSLTLRTSKEPIWLNVIEPGVRVKVPPLDVAVMRAAGYRAMKAAAEARISAGIGDDEVPDDAQVGVLEGAFTAARIRALAERIVEWEGIVGEDGAPLPITSDNLDAFASHPVAGMNFLNAYEAPVQAVVTEGNGSGKSTVGGTAADPSTAPAAPATPQETPPVAPPALAPSMRRKPKPGQPARLQ
jgi:hypothetical protein